MNKGATTAKRIQEERVQELLDCRVPREAVEVGHSYVIFAPNGGVAIA